MEKMMNQAVEAPTPRATSTTAGQVSSREHYVPPALERLG